MITTDSWIGTGNEEVAIALATDGTYIYAVIYYDADSDSTVIIKIDPSDMSEVGRWDTEQSVEIRRIVADGGYLYVTTYDDIYKIDTSDMTVSATFGLTGGDAAVITLCGGYLFAIAGGSIVKIDPSDMSYAGDAGPLFGYFTLANDGSYVYAGEADGSTIIKLDPDTMSVVDTWDGAPDWEYVIDIDCGGGYLFAAVLNDTLGTNGVVKIDPSDMSTDSTFDVPDDDYTAAVYYGNDAVYVGIAWYMGSPSRFYKIDPATMTQSDSWEGGGSTEGANGFVYLDPYLYVSLQTSPAEVDQTSEAVSYTLTVNTSGSGSVEKDPDQGSYAEGTPVELTAVPADGWAFDHWSGDLTGDTNPDTITMDDNKEVTAHFVALYAYSLTINIDGLGTVTKNPDKSTYDPGEVVEMTAVPGDSWFKEWQGDATGGTNPKSITMSSDKTVTAVFSRDQLVATYTAPGGQYPSQAMAGDSTSLYLALGGATIYLKKVGKGNMGSTYSKSYANFGAPYCILVDGDDLFFGFQYHPASYPFDNARVNKAQSSNLDGITHWWGGATGDMYDPGFKSLAVDATYVYFGVVYGSGSRVVKLLRSDMSYVAYWTNSPADSAYRGPSLCMAGGYLYAGLNPLSGTPVILHKINPATMASVATWDASPYMKSVRQIVYDGTYLYVSFSTDPAVVVKIDPTTMTEVDRWTGETGQDDARGICVDEGRLYVGCSSSPAQVVVVDADTMTTIDTWTADTGQNGLIAVTPDFIYAALMTNPGKIVKLFFPSSYGFPHSQAGMVW